MVPWAQLLEQLRPHYYSKAGKVPGRPPLRSELMLCLKFLQQWFDLANEALEDDVYDSPAFVGIFGLDLGREAEPDASILLSFHHLLQTTGLTKTQCDSFILMLRERGLLVNKGTLLDATIIAAPAST